MTIKIPSNVVFLNAAGEPLPDWLQGPLGRQVCRLERDFPALGGDLAVIQTLLDEVGQRVADKVAEGLEIQNVPAYVDAATKHAAIDATKHRHDGLDTTVPVSYDFCDQRSSPTGPLLWREATEWLNAQEEEILIRYFWYGEKHREIAKGLGLSPTAARSRFSRAMDKVRIRFQTRTEPNRS